MHVFVLAQSLQVVSPGSEIAVVLQAYLGLPGIRSTMSTVWHPSARNFSSSKLTPSSIRLLHTYTQKAALLSMLHATSLWSACVAFGDLTWATADASSESFPLQDLTVHYFFNLFNG